MARFGCPDTFQNFRGTWTRAATLCLLVSLFSLMFSAMLRDAFNDCDIGIGLRYRFNGNLFNLKRLQAKTKVKKETVCDLLYADDCAFKAHT
jgi:hypothetical protein